MTAFFQYRPTADNFGSGGFRLLSRWGCAKTIGRSKKAGGLAYSTDTHRHAAAARWNPFAIPCLTSGLARCSATVLLLALFTGCQNLPPPPKLSGDELVVTPEYLIAPLDTVQIFVWRAPDLSVTVPVRPDGRITIPLVEDLMAAGKSPTVLARDIETSLRPFVQEPKASVVVAGFANQTTQMVKVIGEVARPVTVHYQMHMSVLDVMAEAQGLTEYAYGNHAKLIRKEDGQERTYGLKLQDLLGGGEMSANAKLRPGDLIVVPKSLL